MLQCIKINIQNLFRLFFVPYIYRQMDRQIIDRLIDKYIDRWIDTVYVCVCACVVFNSIFHATHSFETPQKSYHIINSVIKSY